MAFMGLGQLGTTTSVADLWGWTDPLNGREYALVGTRTGTSFVDITDPTAPVLVGILPAQRSGGAYKVRAEDLEALALLIAADLRDGEDFHAGLRRFVAELRAHSPQPDESSASASKRATASCWIGTSSECISGISAK